MQEKNDYPRKIKLLDSEYATFRKGVLDYFCKNVLTEPCIFYDPMAGSASLLPILENNGYISFFNDLLPLHYFINQAKSYEIFQKFRQNGPEWYLIKLLQMLSPLKGKRLYLDSEWINEEVLITLINAWKETQRFHEAEECLLKAIILLSIRSLSSFTSSKNPTWFKPGGVSQDKEIDTIISQSIFRFDEYYRTFYSGHDGKLRGSTTITMETAVSNTISQKADLIITSPPYANRLDLKRQFGPESYFLDKLGYGVSTKDIIGTTVVHDYDTFSSDYEFLINNSEHAKQLFLRIQKYNEHGADYYLKYYCRFFAGLINTILAVLSNLSNTGKAYIVTQDNMHRGFCIEMDTVLRQALKKSGWSSKIVKKWERHHLGLQNVSRNHAFIKPKHFEKIVVFWR